MYGMAGYGHTPGLPKLGTHHEKARGKPATKKTHVRTKAQLRDEGHKTRSK